MPECPACAGKHFALAPMFGDTVEVTVHEASDPPPWLEQTRLEIADGAHLAYEDGDEVKTVALGAGWTRIGRSLSAEVRIDDPTVSRRHALIHREGDTIRVLDDRSLNGVFRNGQRVELDELADGDVIAIGRFELHFLQPSGDRERVLA